MTSVWAPYAGSVELLRPTQGLGSFNGAERCAMHRGDHGWWTAGESLECGTDYGFSLDRGPGRPDPRSAWQPYGVHGPSRAFAPGPLDPAGWPGRDVRGQVIYELHVGTFTSAGTLDGARDRLDHLAELGVGMVELMPIAAFPGRWGWGYDGVYPYAVHHPYGGPDALRRFVSAAHDRGLAVALDVVYNHLGPAGNYLAEFGPYFTSAHATPWGPAINLDAEGSADVRAWIIDNALRWFGEFGVDALRLDAVHELQDASPVHLLAELAERTAALSTHLGRPLSLIAESDRNDPATVTPVCDGGLGMSAQWADDVHHAVHALISGERHGYYVDFGTVDVLRQAMSSVFVHDGSYSTFRATRWGRVVPQQLDRHRFVAFAQNHDQIGNRALGDRMAARTDAAGLAAAAALILLSPYTPMLFMGEEWATARPWQFFTDHEPELGRAVTEGRRREFASHGWTDLYGTKMHVPDPQDPQTFAASTLDWTELSSGSHRRMLDWYRRLIELRALLLDSTVAVTGDHNAFVLDRGTLVVGINLSAHERRLCVPGALREIAARWGGDGAVPDEASTNAGLGDGVIHLGPHSVVVFTRTSAAQLPSSAGEGAPPPVG